MKRPWMVVVATVVQWLLGLGSAALTVYLLALTRSKETLSAQDPAAEIQGLEIAAAVFILPTIVYLLAAYGMQKGKRWGWWLALAMNMVSTGAFLVGTFDVGVRQVDKDVLPFAAGFALVVAWLLLSQVRRFFWRGPAAAT